MSQPGLAGGSGGVDAGLGGGGADDAVLHNIGVMCQHAGVFFDVVSVQPREALRMHGTALDSAIAWHSENNPNVAACYGNIWNVYRAQGKYDEAFVEYQKGLKIEIRVHGCEHDNVANSYNNISNVYSAQGDDENALLQFQKLTIRMRLLGCDAWPPPTLRRWPCRTIILGHSASCKMTTKTRCFSTIKASRSSSWCMDRNIHSLLRRTIISVQSIWNRQGRRSTRSIQKIPREQDLGVRTGPSACSRLQVRLGPSLCRAQRDGYGA